MKTAFNFDNYLSHWEILQKQNCDVFYFLVTEIGTSGDQK